MNTKQLTLRIPENVYGALREKSEYLGIGLNNLIIIALWFRYDVF